MDHVVENKKKNQTLTDFVRSRTKGILEPIALLLNRLGIHPNTMTILGLVGNAIGAILLAMGHMTIGGILILIMGPIDALDGTMARLRGEPSAFGGFVDSVADRYSELVIFGGMLFFYIKQENWWACLVIYAAAAGSVLVSYIRARGQSLGMDTKVGILTRFERYIVLSPALILNFPLVGAGIIAVLANFTALQRILDVRRQARSGNKYHQKIE